MTDENKKQAVAYAIGQLKKGRKNLEKIKREAALRFGTEIIKNADIIAAAPKLQLKKKPVRTLSGITTVALMVKPDGSCSHGCIYCPFTGKAAKSYTGEEPAALRARDANYDPAKQVKIRLKQYTATGHPTEKCELVVMGGTFLEMPNAYKQQFIKAIYESMNGKKAATLATAKKANEKAKNRVIGLTIETRPDVCGKKQIDEMLSYGATRVELGVQHPDDRIYQLINRGHSVADVENATALLKDSAFKVLYHIMPGLPGSSPAKDIALVKKLFSDSRFQPDMLKIYPTLCMKGTKLYEMMERGEYEPYDSEKAAAIIAEMFRYIPKYVRVMRIQRDIPANLISSGVKKSNLRELVAERMKEKGIIAAEIRAREIGLSKKSRKNLELRKCQYNASNGKEIFISYENDEVIAGFLRLRIPGRNVFRPEIVKAALIRELHVYGSEERLGAAGKIQHTGIGKRLLREAEQLAKKENAKKMIIISGVGAREYYRAAGYKPEGPYMAKKL